MYDYGLTRFTKAIEAKQLTLYGALVSQHGRPVGECRWVADAPYNLYSASKSFTSLAIGIAIDEGLLSLDSKPSELLSDQMPKNPGENLLRMTLHDLLIMSSGQDKPYLLGEQRVLLREEKNWVRHYLAQDFPKKPGTHFFYDTGCTYIAGAMLRRVADETVHSYLMPRLFEPLGIPAPRWDACPQGLPLAGAGLHLRLSELHRLGLLCLKKGQWDGRRIVSEAWIEAVKKPHVDLTDRGKPNSIGYGYQFWQGAHRSYRADGRYGQFSIVFDDLDAVVTIQAREYRDTSAILDTVNEVLVPMLEENL